MIRSTDGPILPVGIPFARPLPEGRAMVRMAWVALAIALAAGVFGFAVPVGAALAPLQLTAFLFAVLFLILLILGSPTFRSLI